MVPPGSPHRDQDGKGKPLEIGMRNALDEDLQQADAFGKA